MNNEKLENQLFFNWIQDKELKSWLTLSVKNCKRKRIETQAEISKTLRISLTKIKEIENGKCKDFNAINGYINYYHEGFF